jgi:NAD(P)-dependent dehydrogenase (short-subunit alcohol dehydrogenase family)
VSGGRFDGRVAVVTGGTRGIGRAIAERLEREGADVVVASRAEPSAGLPGRRISHVRCDMAVPEDVERLIAGTVARQGAIDVLVNNAAIEHEATVEHTLVEEWDRVLAVNLRGPFLAIKHAVPHMRRRGGGTIVNIASIDAVWAEPELCAYCTSKGGLLALTRSVAIDHGPEGIRCVAICPSYVRTEMLDQFYDAQPDPAAARRDAAAMHPSRRIAEPDEVAAMTAWLASDEAAFVNGQHLLLDGGLTAGRVRPPASRDPSPARSHEGPRIDDRASRARGN